jgi:hypothetical protein
LRGVSKDEATVPEAGVINAIVSGDAGISPYLARGNGAEICHPDGCAMLAPEPGSGALWIEIPTCFLEERDRT